MEISNEAATASKDKLEPGVQPSFAKIIHEAKDSTNRLRGQLKRDSSAIISITERNVLWNIDFLPHRAYTRPTTNNNGPW